METSRVQISTYPTIKLSIKGRAVIYEVYLRCKKEEDEEEYEEGFYLTFQLIFCQIKLGGGCIFTSKSCSARGGIA